VIGRTSPVTTVFETAVSRKGRSWSALFVFVWLSFCCWNVWAQEPVPVEASPDVAPEAGTAVDAPAVESMTVESAAPLADACAPPVRFHEQLRVERVYDGDTVQLVDGRRLRLIGLDTPERGRDERPAEPFAEDARAALTRLLKEQGWELRLVFDHERFDHHGRTLAHAFAIDGRPVAAWLLEQGLAVALTVPPNDAWLGCYRGAEARARDARSGLWALVEYRVWDAACFNDPRGCVLREATEVREELLTALDPGNDGFRIVKGEVERVGRSRQSWWLNLKGGLALRIDHDDMQYFPGLEPETLEGRQVTARGRLYRHRDQPRMRIRHPADLQFD
jgi:endonuclease YncB( thermonuclease family)